MISGTSLVHVPYRASSPAPLEHARDTRLVMLGVADRHWLAVRLDILTVAESSVPDFES